MIEHISYCRKFLWKASAWRCDDIHTVEHKMEWKELNTIVYKVDNKKYNSSLCPIPYTKTRSIVPIKTSSGISKYWLVMPLPLITKLILLREKQLSPSCYYVLSGRWLQTCALQSDWLCTKHWASYKSFQSSVSTKLQHRAAETAQWAKVLRAWQVEFNPQNPQWTERTDSLYKHIVVSVHACTLTHTHIPSSSSPSS